MVWDKQKPAGNQKIRLSDEEIRANWAAIATCLNESAGVLRTFPATTPMIFYLDAAPTLWTIDNTLDDKLLFVSKGSVAGGETGGGAHSGGAWAITGLTKDAHTHNVTSNVAVGNHTALALNNHTALVLNNEAAHTHTGPSHSHTGPSHAHLMGLAFVGGTLYFPDNSVHGTSGTFAATKAGTLTGGSWNPAEALTNSTGAAATGAGGTGATGTGSNHKHTFSQDIDAHTFSQDISAHSVTNNAVTSGAQSDAGITSAGTWRPDCECVIICTKD